MISFAIFFFIYGTAKALVNSFVIFQSFLSVSDYDVISE